MMRIIVKDMERMESVLNNVLDFSRPDRSNLKMVDLNELVDQTFEMMEPEIDTTRISLINFPSPNLSSVKANPDLLRQALLNISRNAIRAMPQGGVLSVTTGQKESSVKIMIKDSGFGIFPENQNKIFDS